MNSKKVTILCFIATVLIALFGGISVFALTVNHPIDRNKPDHGDIKATAIVEKISDSSIELTLNNKNAQDNSEKLTLTIKDSDEVDDISVGDSVKVRYNDKNELLSIKKIDKSDNKDISDKKTIAKVEKIEGDQITLKEGTIDKDNNDSFKETGESKTYTLDDKDDIDNIKVGDIVKVEIEDNKIKDIDKVNKDSTKNPDQNSNQKDQSFNKNQANDHANYSTDV